MQARVHPEMGVLADHDRPLAGVEHDSGIDDRGSVDPNRMVADHRATMQSHPRIRGEDTHLGRQRQVPRQTLAGGGEQIPGC